MFIRAAIDHHFLLSINFWLIINLNDKLISYSVYKMSKKCEKCEKVLQFPRVQSCIFRLLLFSNQHFRTSKFLIYYYKWQRKAANPSEGQTSKTFCFKTAEAINQLAKMLAVNFLSIDLLIRQNVAALIFMSCLYLKPLRVNYLGFILWHWEG